MTLRMRNQTGQLFRMSAPIPTHRRIATCAEVDCSHYMNGWITKVATGSQAALYIRHLSGRKFVEKAEGGHSTFTFYPGQKCFRSHTASLDRPPFLLHQKGGPIRRIIEPQQFNDTFNEEMYQLEQARKRG